MKAEKAIRHLIKKFNKGFSFSPSTYDKQCLKDIADYYQETQSIINYSQEPFAKLYLFLYLNCLKSRQYEDQTLKPAKIMSNILDTPIFVHISNIQMHLNTHRLDKAQKEILDSNPIKPDASSEDFEKWKQEIEEKQLKAFLSSQLSYEELENQLYQHINGLLENFKSL